MPEYLSPGVYMEEVDRGPRPIQGVGTAMAAFVGFAPAGPVNRPVLITNWSQYTDTFGALEEGGKRNPHLPGAFLSHTVYGYFLNGGNRCYITRISVGGGSGQAERAVPTQLPSRASKAIPSLNISAKGNPASDIQIEVLAATTEEGNTQGLFGLRIRSGADVESYDDLGLATGAKNVATVVNRSSKLVTVADAKGTGSPVERAPEMASFLIKASSTTSLSQVKGNHFTGDVAQRSGVEGLEVADDVTMVCCPDLMAAYQAGSIGKDEVKAVQLAMIAHCERMGDRVAIIDPLPDLSPQEVKNWRMKDSNFDSKYAALYYPWISVAGADGKPMAIPPSGHMAGVWARNDSERGVHKAPANEIVRGALDPVVQITKGEQDVLNPVGINCIRVFSGRGVRVWGARTVSNDPAWRYLNVRRLFNFVEKSVELGTQWVVFEPNDERLWSMVRRDANAFLTGVWRDGALFGSTPEQAFYVKCDAELNPSDVRDRGQLIIEIGMAPVKPAEFVIFRLSQWAGGGA